MRSGHVLLIIGMASTMLLTACGRTEDKPEAPPSATAATVETVSSLPAERIDADAFKIVMLGDSLTAGFGLPREDALPEQMDALFAEAGRENIVMINAGVSGDTTAGGLSRYDWSVKSADPDMLIVALGANDFLGGAPASLARDNLAAIIERAQEDNLPVILASVEAGAIADRDPRIAAYAAIYPELAETYGVPLYQGILTGVRGRPELVQKDGLHPTREGVAIAAARMVDFIETHLPE